MKTKIFTFALFAFLMNFPVFAQDRTTVTATGSEISDNLDLRAVASIFGDSQNLEDFEQRLNDPKVQISNLDLNNDNEVDYLRVIESVEGRTHLIIVQAVLDRDVYQDVATIEVEKGSNNQVQVQVVGDVYMYGQNYIYEPVYVSPPVIYNHFWITNYRPYVSTWYWNYYPTYYYAWTPYPVFRYRNHVHIHINAHNHYNYVNTRRSNTAMVLYNGRRANGYERQYPNRSFERRNTNVTNRYELDRTRKTESIGRQTANNQTRNGVTKNPRTVNSTTRTNPVRNTTIKNGTNEPIRVQNNGATRENTPVRTQNTPQNTSQPTRINNPIKSENSVRNQNNATRTPTTNTRPTVIKPQTPVRQQNNVRSQPSEVKNTAQQKGSRSENTEGRRR